MIAIDQEIILLALDYLPGLEVVCLVLLFVRCSFYVVYNKLYLENHLTQNLYNIRICDSGNLERQLYSEGLVMKNQLNLTRTEPIVCLDQA